VNNAGVVSGKTFLEVSDKMAELTMDVNILAHFWTVKAFLPDMIRENKGHIVTIASAAGIVGVHGLADYCASKFAAFGFDESIRMELRKLGKKGVKTTCICPYFINTGMFAGCKTKFPLLLPVMDENYVADKIIEAVREDREFVGLPRFVHYMNFLARALFPTSIFDLLSEHLGTSDAMDDFIGRKSRSHG